MTSNIGPTEVSFEVRSDSEYATLHADTFRTAMRECDELRTANKVLQLRGDTYLEQLQAVHVENERLREEKEISDGVAEKAIQERDDAMHRLERADAEIERLRAHLESKAW